MKLFLRVAGLRELPWGLILVIAVVVAIILGGFWAAFEVWNRANDGVYGG